MTRVIWEGSQESLIHEATHALNQARDVQDCSASRYHNRAFKSAAAELGLAQKEGVSDVDRKDRGFAFTEPTQETAAVYAGVIALPDAAIGAPECGCTPPP